MSDDPSREHEGVSGLLKKQQEFIKTFFKRGAEFAEQLLRENERLRFRLLEVEALLPTGEVLPGEEGPKAEAVRELLGRIEVLEQERRGRLRRYSAIEQENCDWKKRYGEVERENSNLANLYVASYQLHSTLDLREVLQIIHEILLNLVGAKTFALYLI